MESTPITEGDPTQEGTFFCNMAMGSCACTCCPAPNCGVDITQYFGMHHHIGNCYHFAAVHFPGEPTLVPCPTRGLQVPYVDRHQGTELCCCIVECQ